MYNSYPTKKVVTNDKSSHECIYILKCFYTKKDYIEKCVVILILKTLGDSVTKVII